MDPEEERKKEEIRKLLESFIDFKSKKELQKSCFNQLKIDAQWREMLREAKSDELIRILKLLIKSFEASLAYKDLKIDILRNQLCEADVQQMWAIQTHVETMNELIENAHQRIEQLRQHYLTELAVLKEDFEKVKQEMEARDEVDIIKAKELQFVIKFIFEETIEESKIHYREKWKDADLEEIARIQQVYQKYDPQILEIWKKIQSALLHYMEHGKKLEVVYHKLKAECNEVTLEAQKQNEYMEQLNSTIPELKEQMTKMLERMNDRITKTEKENQEFCEHANRVKEQIFRLEKMDKASLTRLVLNSKEALIELKRLLSKAEKVVKLDEYCRKLENECCVTYDAKTVLSSEEMEQIKIQSSFVPPEDLGIENLEHFGLLENLTKRTGKVLLENLAMQCELGELQKDNIQLQNKMSNFLKSVAEGEFIRIPIKDNTTEKNPPLIQEGALLSKYIITDW